MNRTTLEIAAATSFAAAIGLLYCELRELRADHRVRLARAEAEYAIRPEPGTLRSEFSAQREELRDALTARLEPLEERNRLDAASARDAAWLAEQLDQARRTAAQQGERLAADVDSTRSLVAAQESTLRDVARRAREADSRSRELLDRLGGQVPPNKRQLNHELLLPTVQLEGGDTVGAGTLVRSWRDPDTGEVENWVLTAWHVCRNIFADSPSAKRDGLRVHAWLNPERMIRLRGKVVAHDASIDVALIRLTTDRVFDHVADVATTDRMNALTVWDDVFAVGCPLGTDPIATRGSITSTRNEIRGTNYWMISAPTYYGNSGGGVFAAERRELIGVFSKIYTHGAGLPVVVPHMGLCTPMSTVRAWLADEDLAHVLGDATVSAGYDKSEISKSDQSEATPPESTRSEAEQRATSQPATSLPAAPGK